MKKKVLICFFIAGMFSVAFSSAACNSGADSDSDNSVTMEELASFIEEWKDGGIIISNVLEAIGEWKNGCSVPCKNLGEVCEIGECCGGLKCYDCICDIGKPTSPEEHPVNDWIKQTPTSERIASDFNWEGAGSFDPYNLVWIHEGGHDTHGTPQSFALWTWDMQTGNWTIQFPNDGPPGSCCVDGSSSFDRANRRYIKTVGAYLSHGYQWVRSIHLRGKHIWLYDVDRNEWTDPLPPPYDHENLNLDDFARTDIASEYNKNSQTTFFFGGGRWTGNSERVYMYDAYSNDLKRLNDGNLALRRNGAGFSYDSKRDVFLMFGAQYLADNKTWIYDPSANSWESYELVPSPPSEYTGRYASIPRIAYDSINDVHIAVIFIGNVTINNNVGILETWAFYPDELRWEKLSPVHGLDMTTCRSRNIDFIPELNLFILENKYVGVDNEYNINQLWTYRYANATDEYLNRIMSPRSPLASTTSNTVTISWSESPTENIDSYKIYRAQGEVHVLAFQEIEETSQLSYTDSDVQAGNIYFYRITAVKSGVESEPSLFVRTQPRFMPKPVVSVLDTNNIKITWEPHSADDVVGYNIYRGVAKIHTNTTIHYLWPDNRTSYTNYPYYNESVVEMVRNIVNIEKLNTDLITGTSYFDTSADLLDVPPESEDYRYAVYAYIIRAVNELGVESGPSPYALTIPSAPQHFLINSGVLKWDANPEESVVGYYIYQYNHSYGPTIKYTDELIESTTYDLGQDISNVARFWVVPVDSLGQEGVPSVPVWYRLYKDIFYEGDWHQ